MEKELNITMENIANSLKAKQLNLNVKKSNLLLFNLGRNRKKENLNIHLDTEELEQKQFAKYLGIYINENLSWHKHMQMTINKISKGIGILRTMSHFLQEKQLKDLYYSFIKSYTEYDNLAWGGAAKANLAKIDRSLRNAIRIMMFQGKRKSVQPLYEYLNILPLNINRKLLCAKFMQKLESKKHPIVIENKLPLHYNKSIDNSAHKKLIVPYFRTSLRVSSLMYQGFKIWNEIPLHFKIIESTKLFSRKYKEHFFKSASVWYIIFTYLNIWVAMYTFLRAYL